MSLAIVRPPDCSLAVGIPLTREDFLADLSRPDLHDFAVGLTDGASEADHREAWRSYAPIAGLLSEVCNEVAAHGVTVVRTARLSDFADLTVHPIVTLVTHWRFSEIGPADLLDPAAILASVRTATEGAPAAVRRRLLNSEPRLLDPDAASVTGETKLRNSLAGALSAIVREAHSWYVPGSGSADSAAGPDVLDRLTREALEYAFGHTLKPAPAVEFSDRLRTVADVVDSIPSNYAGVFDLTICNAAILGHAIRRVRRDCLAIVGRSQVDPVPRIVAYKLVIAELARRPSSYLDAFQRVYERLTKRR